MQGIISGAAITVIFGMLLGIAFIGIVAAVQVARQQRDHASLVRGLPALLAGIVPVAFIVNDGGWASVGIVVFGLLGAGWTIYRARR